MGVWKTLRRPRCVGMYIEDGRLYTHRSRLEPDFMLAATNAERAEFLRPIAHDLKGARVKYEVVRDAPTMAVGVAVGPVIPIMPVGGKKNLLITVVLPDGQQLMGWSRNIGQTLRFCRALNKAATRQG